MIDKRILLQQAKQANPNLTREQAMKILETADSMNTSQPQEPSGMDATAKWIADNGGALKGTIKGLATNKAIPDIGSVLGSIIGMIGGSKGSDVGAGLGYAVPRIAQETAQSMMGIQDQSIPEQLKDVGFKSTTAAAANMGGRKLGEGLAAILKPIGKGVYNWGLSRPAAVAEKEFVKNASNKEGYSVANEMMKRNIRGNPTQWYKMASDNAQKAWSQIEKIAGDKVDDVVVTSQQLQDDFLNKLEIMRNSFNKGPLKEGKINSFLSKADEILRDILQEHGPNLTYKDLIQLNAAANDTMYVGKSGFRSSSQAAEKGVWNMLDGIFKNYIDDAPTKLRPFLKEYGENAQIMNVAVKSGAKFPAPPGSEFQVQNLPFRLLKAPMITTNLGLLLNKAKPQNFLGPLGAYLGGQ